MPKHMKKNDLKLIKTGVKINYCMPNIKFILSLIKKCILHLFQRIKFVQKSSSGMGSFRHCTNTFCSKIFGILNLTAFNAELARFYCVEFERKENH